MADTDSSIDTIYQGRAAAALRADIEYRCNILEDRIVTRLVHDYRSKRLTDSQLRGGIGEISALRGILESIDSDVRRGIADAQSEEERTDGQEAAEPEPY